MDNTIRFLKAGLLWGGLFTFLLAAPAVTLATPTLQVDLAADSVWYEPAPEESVMTGAEDFTVYALLTPKDEEDAALLLGKTYYLSIALTPAFEGPYDPTLDLGSFTLNGEEIQVTADMVYGVPPIENASVYQPKDPGDLSQHGIYPTYYLEVAFQFDPDLETATYNVQDNPGEFTGAGTGSYYVPFEIASATLDGETFLHFDLYDEQVKSGDTDIGIFAPFSHDAGTTKVPEPGMFSLLSMGLLGLGLVSRRLS